MSRADREALVRAALEEAAKCILDRGIWFLDDVTEKVIINNMADAIRALDPTTIAAGVELELPPDGSTLRTLGERLWDKYHIESDESLEECIERTIDGWKRRALKAESKLVR